MSPRKPQTGSLAVLLISVMSIISLGHMERNQGGLSPKIKVLGGGVCNLSPSVLHQFRIQPTKVQLIYYHVRPSRDPQDKGRICSEELPVRLHSFESCLGLLLGYYLTSLS